MLIMAIVVMTSCENNKLPESVQAFSGKCPITIDGFGEGNELTSVTLENNEVTLLCTTTKNDKESNGSIAKNVMSMGDSFKLLAYNYLLKNGPEFKAVIEEAQKAGAKVKIVVKEKDSDKSVEFPVTAPDMQAIADGSFKIDENQVMLQAAVNSANAYLPRTEQGMTVNGVSLSDEYVELNWTLDERKVSMKTMESVLPRYKSMMLPTKETEYKDIVDLCLKANHGIKYVFHGSKSDSSFEIVYTVDELQKARK